MLHRRKALHLLNLDKTAHLGGSARQSLALNTATQAPAWREKLIHHL